MVLLLAGCGDDNPAQSPPQADCSTPGTVLVDGKAVPSAPSGYVTVGNQILRASDCQPMRFVGVSRPSLSLTADGGRLNSDTATATDFRLIRSWRANTVKLELAQYFWVSTSRHHDPGYKARVDRVVRQAREAGLHVILTLQHSDRGDPNYPDVYSNNMHQPMPDMNHSVPFWREVAARYKDDGGILYELYSEPYPVGGKQGFSNWDMWLNGGNHPADEVYNERRAPFLAVGMQQLYDVVRSTGANNVVIISGTSWGYFLDGVPDHRVKGYNIAYAAHPWDWPGKQPETFDKDWAFLAKTDPVMITEFGNYDCTEPYVRAVLNKADQLNLSWTAWAWIAPAPGVSRAQNGRGDPICGFPMLITDYDGTPSRWGNIIKNQLAGY